MHAEIPAAREESEQIYTGNFTFTPEKNPEVFTDVLFLTSLHGVAEREEQENEKPYNVIIARGDNTYYVSKSVILRVNRAFLDSGSYVIIYQAEDEIVLMKLLEYKEQYIDWLNGVIRHTDSYFSEFEARKSDIKHINPGIIICKIYDHIGVVVPANNIRAFINYVTESSFLKTLDLKGENS